MQGSLSVLAEQRQQGLLLDVGTRLGHVERSLVIVQEAVVNLTHRMDRFEEPLQRIEHRLDLIDEPSR